MKTNFTTFASRLAESSKRLVRTLGCMRNPGPPRMPPQCVNINALLLHLCDFDHEVYAYVLKWLAYPLQRPGARMSRALVFNGGQGSGKDLFFRHVVANLYADSARRLKDSALASVFTPWALGARFVLVDGTFTSKAQDTLKFFLASEVVAINAKGMALRTERNRMNFVFLSNAHDFLPSSVSHRRFAVIEVPPPRQRVFYEAVWAEIHNGGIDAFRSYLRHGIDLGTFDEYTLPPASVRTAHHKEAA
ncbi:MAG: primase-helicase family protein [Telluria sp.]